MFRLIPMVLLICLPHVAMGWSEMSEQLLIEAEEERIALVNEVSDYEGRHGKLIEVFNQFSIKSTAEDFNDYNKWSTQLQSDIIKTMEDSALRRRITANEIKKSGYKVPLIKVGDKTIYNVGVIATRGEKCKLSCDRGQLVFPIASIPDKHRRALGLPLAANIAMAKIKKDLVKRDKAIKMALKKSNVIIGLKARKKVTASDLDKQSKTHYYTDIQTGAVTNRIVITKSKRTETIIEAEVSLHNIGKKPAKVTCEYYFIAKQGRYLFIHRHIEESFHLKPMEMLEQIRSNDPLVINKVIKDGYINLSTRESGYRPEGCIVIVRDQFGRLLWHGGSTDKTKDYAEVWSKSFPTNPSLQRIDGEENTYIDFKDNQEDKDVEPLNFLSAAY